MSEDLISRDRLRGELAGTNFNDINDWKKVNEIIDRQPEEPKHGRWVKYDNGVCYCSVCQNEAYWDTDYGQQLFEYCPHCGAAMDKEKD